MIFSRAHSRRIKYLFGEQPKNPKLKSNIFGWKKDPRVSTSSGWGYNMHTCGKLNSLKSFTLWMCVCLCVFGAGKLVYLPIILRKSITSTPRHHHHPTANADTPWISQTGESMKCYRLNHNQALQLNHPNYQRSIVRHCWDILICLCVCQVKVCAPIVQTVRKANCTQSIINRKCLNQPSQSFVTGWTGSISK